MPNEVSTVNVPKMDFFIVVAKVVLSHHTLACLASAVGTVATHVLDAVRLAAAAVPSGDRCWQSSRRVSPPARFAEMTVIRRQHTRRQCAIGPARKCGLRGALVQPHPARGRHVDHTTRTRFVCKAEAQ
jgi:hypothetical protein